MNSKPAISIITPAYNAEKYIERIHQSLLDQDFKDFEWIIIDDDSIDHTYTQIQKIIKNTSLNIKTIRNPKNLGIAASRNKGLDLAQGQYICFLDSDDLWSKEKLSIQYQYMIKNNILMSYMDYDHVTPNKTYIKTIRCPISCSKNSLLKSNHIGNLTCMVNNNIIQSTRFKNHGHEDYIFWLEILSKIDYAYKTCTTKPLCHYAISDKSTSSNKLITAKWQWSIYRNILNLNIITSLYFFSSYIIKGIIKHKL